MWGIEGVVKKMLFSTGERRRSNKGDPHLFSPQTSKVFYISRNLMGYGKVGDSKNKFKKDWLFRWRSK